MNQSDDWHFWIDRGGTFTDIVAWKAGAESLRMSKVLSDDPSRGEDAPLAAIRSVLDLGSADPLDALGAVTIRLGTTVATNALLTGTGVPTVVVLTRGFKDQLLIGDQTRSDLFSLDITRPSPIWHSIVEADERIGANGEIVRALDEKNLREQLEVCAHRGAESCAISFMHGWRYPVHERRAFEIAREIGFRHVVAGSEASPLEGFLARSQTSVIDAMLTPILKESVRCIYEALPHAKIEFMQSSGGLTSPEDFRGMHAVLSGPAGGIVGAAKIAELAGIREIITFDMGGTSTDVAWHDGQLHRTWDTRFHGLRLRVPMLEIDTIAAGGGSICRFDGQRLRVGPESAGAHPGPACYRLGGPATLTDCQMVLGRLSPELLPATFGNNRDQPADPEASRARFRAIKESMLGLVEMSLEEIAEGCIRIAVAHMAAAVRRISIEKGRAVDDAMLIAFGGAGGQTACLVAEVLGIDRILIHPQAGVLSALGIGLASPRMSSERSVGCPLEDSACYRRNLDELEKELSWQMENRGISSDRLKVKRRLHLQVLGWDGSLPVPESSIDSMRGQFLEMAASRYGFSLPPESRIVVDMVEVAVEVSEFNPIIRMNCPDISPLSDRRTKAWFNGRYREVDVRDRSTIHPGDIIYGPAIIEEDGSTTILEPDWTLLCTHEGNLLLERSVRPNAKSNAKQDPVSLEIFSHIFMSIAEEMGITLRQTAHSVNIKERLDFSCAIFTADGELVANGPHVPVHLGSMDESVKAILSQCDTEMRPGDAWLLNDPYNGGTHLPDLTVVTPVFAGEENLLSFFVASRGHHADVGGLTPGSMPANSTSIDEEGVVIPPVRIVQSSLMDESLVRTLLTSVQYPARNPDQNLADLRAQLAANARGVEELQALVDIYGLNAIQDRMRAVIDAGEACVRRLLPNLETGTAEMVMDHGSVIRVTTKHEDQGFVFDFTGTTGQVAGNFNAPMSVTRAAVMYVLRCLVGDDIPLNAGCLRPIRIDVPEHSILDPRSPAAVVAGNVETSQCIVDTILAALKIEAASQGTMNNLTFGDQELQYYETVCGGVGGGNGFHGADAVHSHMTNSSLTDPEILERRYPVRLERFCIRPGSGGKGCWNGGNGVIRDIRFLRPMTLTLLSGRRTQPPQGLLGGLPGWTGTQHVVRSDGSIQPLPSCCSVQMLKDDVFHLETPGGGGFREPE